MFLKFAQQMKEERGHEVVMILAYKSNSFIDYVYTVNGEKRTDCYIYEV